MNRSALIILDKTIFRMVFWMVVLFSKLRPCKPHVHQPKLSGDEHFLVIRPGGMGDGIMSVPLLRSLRENFPNGRITLLCVKKSSPAFVHLPYHDKLIVFDSMGHLPENLLYLLRNKFDVVLDLEQFRRITSIISYIAGRDIRIGFDTNSRRLLYSHFVTYPNEKNFESLNMVRQLEILGIDVPREEGMDLGFPLPREFEERAGSVLDSVSVRREKDFLVAVFPGVLKPHHRWRMEEFAKLVHLILGGEKDARIVLMGSAADIPDSESVLEHAGRSERIINLVGKTGFMESLGILKSCKVLIACDGGAVYMGASMGCSTISLWGPGVMERFKPPGENHKGVRKGYYCIPCVNYGRLGEFPPCPYGRRCLNDITAREVYLQYKVLKAPAPGN